MDFGPTKQTVMEAERPLSPTSRRKFIQRAILSYFLDLFVILVLFIPAIISPFISPTQRPFDLDDPAISKPFNTSEIFPTWTLPVLTCF